MEEPTEKMSAPITIVEQSPGVSVQEAPIGGQRLHQQVTKQMIIFSFYIALIGLVFNFDLGQTQ